MLFFCAEKSTKFGNLDNCNAVLEVNVVAVNSLVSCGKLGKCGLIILLGYGVDTLAVVVGGNGNKANTLASRLAHLNSGANDGIVVLVYHADNVLSALFLCDLGNGNGKIAVCVKLLGLGEVGILIALGQRKNRCSKLLVGGVRNLTLCVGGHRECNSTLGRKENLRVLYRIAVLVNHGYGIGRLLGRLIVAAVIVFTVATVAAIASKQTYGHSKKHASNQYC